MAAALLVGVGAATRRLLAKVIVTGEDTPAVHRADPWIGLAATIGYLQLWSLIAPIGRLTAMPIIIVGGAGLVTLARKPPQRLRLKRTVVAVAAVAVLWLGNNALGPPTSYDSGLYHFAAIEYASEFRAIPGLVNLHYRLGASGPHFLFTALLGQPPWSDAGFHLANGLLIALLLLEVAVRIGTTTKQASQSSLVIPLAAVLGPSVVALMLVDPPGRLSSPSTDLPAVVFFVVGTLFLADVVEDRADLAVLLAMSGAYAVAVAIRPELAPSAITAVVVVGIVLSRRNQLRRPVVLALATMPVMLTLGWAARQAVHSGLPLFPFAFPSLPVDWRIPEPTREEYVAIVKSWARLPGGVPDEVLGSWSWLGPWGRRTITDVDVVLALLIAAIGISLIALRSSAFVQRRRERRATLIAVISPPAVGLVTWFFIAPDPRLALGALWVAAAALVAWSLPSERATAIASIASIGLLIGVALSTGTLLTYVIPDGEGPLGSAPPPSVLVRASSSPSTPGISVPLTGDQCWRLLWCTPRINPGLRLRSDDPEDGFSVMSRLTPRDVPRSRTSP